MTKIINNKHIYLVFIVIILLVLSSCKSIDYMKHASNSYNCERYSFSYFFVKQQLKKDNNNTNALRLKADLETKRSQFLKAKKTYEDLILLTKPSEIQLLDYNDYANILYKTGDVESAIYYFSRILEFDSTLSPANFNMAVIYFEEFDSLKTALSYIERELISNKDDVFSLLLKADILLALQEFDQVKDIVHRTLEMNSTIPKAYIILGRTNFILKDYTNALKCFSEAISLSKSNSSYYVRRGATNALLGNYNMALKDYNRAINLDKNYIEAYEGRLHIYWKIGKSKKVCRDIKKIARLDKEGTYELKYVQYDCR